MTVDELEAEMKDEFANVRAEMKDEFETVRTEMRDGFEAVRTEFKNVRTEIKVDGETTRRHFDIMVEKVHDSVRLVAEGAAHNAARLDNHEKRLKAFEKPRRA